MLIVTGPSCAGKTTLGRIARQLGRPVVEGTVAVREMFAEQCQSGEDLIAFCTRLYREQGENVFAKPNLARLQEADIDLEHLVFIGPRALGEVEYFRSHVHQVEVIAVFANASTRFLRSRLRDREDASLSFEDFIRRDMRELQMGLARLLSDGNYTLLPNEGAKDDFQGAVERLINERSRTT